MKIILDITSRLWYILDHNEVSYIMIIFANVGKPGNMARFMLLYIQKTCFCRKSASRFFHNSRNPKYIPKTGLSANSVNFCKFPETFPTLLAPVLLNKHPTNSSEHKPVTFTVSPWAVLACCHPPSRKRGRYPLPTSTSKIRFRILPAWLGMRGEVKL